MTNEKNRKFPIASSCAVVISLNETRSDSTGSVMKRDNLADVQGPLVCIIIPTWVLPGNLHVLMAPFPSCFFSVFLVANR